MWCGGDLLQHNTRIPMRTLPSWIHRKSRILRSWTWLCFQVIIIITKKCYNQIFEASKPELIFIDEYVTCAWFRGCQYFIFFFCSESVRSATTSTSAPWPTGVAWPTRYASTLTGRSIAARVSRGSSEIRQILLTSGPHLPKVMHGDRNNAVGRHLNNE